MGDQIKNLENELAKRYIYNKLAEKFPYTPVNLDIKNQQIIVYDFPKDWNFCEQLRLYLASLDCYNVEFYLYY